MHRISTPNYRFRDTMAPARTCQRFWSEPNLPFVTNDYTFSRTHLFDSSQMVHLHGEREPPISAANVTKSSTLLQNITMGSINLRKLATTSQKSTLSVDFSPKDRPELALRLSKDLGRDESSHEESPIGISGWDTSLLYYQNRKITTPALSVADGGRSNDALPCLPHPPLCPAPNKPLPAVPTVLSSSQYHPELLKSSISRAKKDSGVSMDSIQDVSCKTSFTETHSNCATQPTTPPPKPPKLQSPHRIVPQSELCQENATQDYKSRKMRATSRKLRDLQVSREYSMSSGPTPLPSPIDTESPTFNTMIATAKGTCLRDESGRNAANHGNLTSPLPSGQQQLDLSFTPMMLVAEQAPVPCTYRMLRRRPAFLAQSDYTCIKPDAIAVRSEPESVPKSLTLPASIAFSHNRHFEDSKMLYGSQFPAPPARSNSSKLRHPFTTRKSESKPKDVELERRYLVSLVEESKVLRQRNNHLEKQNKMLEAALMVALRTAGRLNGCPCGGQGLESSGSPTTDYGLEDAGRYAGNDKLNAMDVFYRTRTKLGHQRS